MLIPIRRVLGLSSLGVPPGVDAEFVDAFRRWENLQAAAASGSHSSGVALTSSAAGASKGFADGLAAWLNPQAAVQEIAAGFGNLGGTNVAYFGGLLAVPLGLIIVLRRR